MDRAGAELIPPPLIPSKQKQQKHFTFVDTASFESRRPRLAARRDPRLVVFEKSRDFANSPDLLVLLKLLSFFGFVSFYSEGKLDSSHTHTSWLLCLFVARRPYSQRHHLVIRQGGKLVNKIHRIAGI